MKKQFCLLLVLLGFSTTAMAGLWVEPYLGVHLGGSLEYTTSNAGSQNGDTEIEISGTSYGLRLGYSAMMIAAGLQYEMGTNEEKVEKDPTASNVGGISENDVTNMGVFVAFTALPLVNVWGTYFFDSTWEDSLNPGLGDELTGTGMAVGAGFTGLPFLQINLEYRMMTMDEFKDVSAGTTTTLPSTFQTEQDVKSIFLSLSVPFDF